MPASLRGPGEDQAVQDFGTTREAESGSLTRIKVAGPRCPPRSIGVIESVNSSGSHGADYSTIEETGELRIALIGEALAWTLAGVQCLTR
jgi:hypothetical protein